MGLIYQKKRPSSNQEIEQTDTLYREEIYSIGMRLNVE